MCDGNTANTPIHLLYVVVRWRWNTPGPILLFSAHWRMLMHPHPLWDLFCPQVLWVIRWLVFCATAIVLAWWLVSMLVGVRLPLKWLSQSTPIDVEMTLPLHRKVQWYIFNCWLKWVSARCKNKRNGRMHHKYVLRTGDGSQERIHLFMASFNNVLTRNRNTNRNHFNGNDFFFWRIERFLCARNYMNRLLDVGVNTVGRCVH